MSIEIDKLIAKFFNIKLIKAEKIMDAWSLHFKPGIMLTWSDIAWLKENGWYIHGIIHNPEYLIVMITNKGALAE